MKTKPGIVFFRSLIKALTLWFCFTLSLVALGHDGPEHEIEELTERITKEGDSADLRLQRAIEYKVLGKLSEAAKDLERALQFDSNLVAAQRELGLTYFALGKTNEALATVNRALKNPSEEPDHASLLMVRAEIFHARKEHKKALEDADLAIRGHPENAEWYLFRSQLQAFLKMKQERIKGLEEGVKGTGSGLLEAEWVDALLDNGQDEAALPKIETELKQSRLKSTWLIRRAKARIASGKGEEAKSDLEFAITELNRRITPDAPDGLLLVDRGKAYELLGKKEEARKDYEKAREKGITDDWVRERLRVLKDGGNREKEEKPKTKGDED